jgi:hypothetical protein
MLDTSHSGGPPRKKADESAGWQAVRESWVDGVPASELRLRSEPPPLPPSVRELPLERGRLESAIADRMFDRLAANDWAGALMAAEALLLRDPRDADALDCAEMSRVELEKLYASRLGDLARVARLAVARDAVATLDLDPRAVSCLLRVDGHATLGEIVREGAIAPHDALRALSELYLRGIITL